MQEKATPPTAGDAGAEEERTVEERTVEGRTVQVNGARRQVPLGSTVADLIASLGRDPRTVAVELNSSIVPRDRYARISLQESDRLEIVQFVQGG